MNSEHAKRAKEAGNTLSEHAREFALAEYRRFDPLIRNADRPDLEALAAMLLQKRSVDGLNGRRWDASAHLCFEEAVDALLRALARS